VREEHKNEEAIFNAAIKIESPAERAAFVKSACGDDATLLARVEALLKVHFEDGSFLKSPPGGIASTLGAPPPTEGPGTKIGRYKLLQLIGEGGFGAVYMAEQEEPIRRKVALKIIKLGMDTKQVIARFEVERQALAMMEHPNIAKVLDAGATDTGRPYFVMELVKGISITEYCDKNNLDTRQRLDLFIDVCKAVQHAHQKGIIHRDIKPSNVMITLHDGKPVPKIIDFGIAKATQHRLTEKTLFTEYRQFIGTPEYMSPEQAEMGGLDVDTRTDIYSLGVLLYELLTGTTPFEADKLRSAAYDEIRRIIREEEPPKPSTRLSTLGDALTEVAKHRQAEAGQLCKIVRGDLDWIVMKTLEKDRTRRYETASEFAMDIGRHLNDEPVSAGPPSAVYRMKKFVRRNQVLVTGVAAVLVVLVAGIVVSTVFAIGQARARAQADKARSVAEEARTAEAEQRKLAETKTEDLRRSLYVNSINLADSKYKEGNIARVRELLDLCPADLRGWEWDRLWHISDQVMMTLRGHQNMVFSVAIDPDGEHIISGSQDGTVKVWDAETGSELRTLQHQHGATVWSVAFNRKTQRIVSCDSSYAWGEIKVWDIATGKELMTIRDKDVLSVAFVTFSPDGNQIVSCSDKVVKVWDAATGTQAMTLIGHNNNVVSVAVSPDGKRIVSGGADNMIKVWDASTGTELMSLRGHRRGVNSVAFSPDGKRITSGGFDTTIKVWDVSTGAELMTIQGHSARICSVVFSPDGKYIASGSYDNTIKVWDAATGDEIMTLRGHSSAVSSVAFSADGKHVVSGGLDKTIKVWDITIDRERLKLRGDGRPIYFIAFSADGKKLVSCGGKFVKIWDMASGSELMTLHGHKSTVVSVACSPDGKYIASSSVDGTVNICDARTGATITTLRGPEGPVHPIAFSPDGKSLAWASYDGKIKVWDVVTGAEFMTLQGHENFVRSLAFSPDGKRIASAGGGTVKIWDAATGVEVMPLRGHNRQVWHIAFSPDGKRVVSGGLGEIKVWDAVTGAELITLSDYTGVIHSVAFSPDGKRIISGGPDAIVGVWDTETGAELLRLKTADSVTSAAFSPDGKVIAAATFWSDIIVWDSVAPADGYEPRKNGEAARKIVDDLYKEYGYYYEVIDKVEADKMLDEPIRKLALQIANSRKWEDAEKLDKQGSESVGPEEVKADRRLKVDRVQ